MAGRLQQAPRFSPTQPRGSPMNAEPTIRDRWMGAICYAGFLVVIPMIQRQRSEFLAAHARQGFALLFAEVVAGALVWILESAFQAIPVVGFVVTLLLVLAYGLPVLGLSVFGFVKALSGEEFRIHGLDELADRVPIQARDTREQL
jgi:uncharacterized membrane protein